MVGVPQALSTGGSQTKPPFPPSFQPSPASQSLQMFPGRQAIDATLRADSLVACQYFFADISGIRSQPPLLHAPVRTESQPTLRHFQTAPAAQISAVRAFGKTVTISPPARHRSCGTHGPIMQLERRRLSTGTSHKKFTFFDAFWVVQKEQEYTGRHLTLRELAAQPGFGYTPQLHQLQVKGCWAPCCG
jgi:hypothetical protein